MIKNILKSTVTPFARNQEGSATPLAIGFSIIFIVLGGIAVDFNKAVGERTQMQMATDSAAHAGLYWWERNNVADSRLTAMEVVRDTLPDVAFRDALQATDVIFGFWDPATGEFTEDETFVEDKDDPRRSAVRAFAELEPERDNESRNIFLSIVGQDTFTIRARSTYISYYPPCFNEGFVADDVVDMQSNSNYLDGFCMHSNKYVSLNQNNYFEPGTVVSMPDISDLDIPNSGFDKNEGLYEALRPGKYRLRVLAQFDDMFASLRAGETKYAEFADVTTEGVLYPVKIGGNGNNAGSSVEEIEAAQAAASQDPPDLTFANNLDRMDSFDTGNKTVTPEQFTPGNRIYRLDCSGNGDITFSGDTFSNFVLVTNCPIKYSNGTALEDVLIATEGDVSGSHIRLGRDDGCAEGGGAGIWTYGTFSSASGLQAYNAQILAHEDILFSAQADGIEGVSFIAYGTIDGTSNNDMGFCNGGGTNDFVIVPYFRMIE